MNLKKFGLLLAGNGIGQIIQFLCIPALTRIYEPNNFGILAQIQSIATAISIIITLQLHHIIPLAKSRETSRNTTIAIAIMVAIIASILLPLVALMQQLGLQSLYLAIILGYTNILISCAIYHGAFRILSSFYTVRSVILLICILVLSFMPLGAGLVSGTLLGETLAAAYLCALLFRSSQWPSISNLMLGKTIRSIKKLIIDNQSFSLYGTVQEFVSVALFYSPVLILSFKYGNVISGQYAMAARLVWAPVVLLSTSYYQVCYHDFSRNRPVLSFKDFVSKSNLIIAGLILVVSTILKIYPNIVVLIIGREWTVASLMLPILGLWGAVFYLSTPYRVLVRLLKKQRLQLIIDTSFLATLLLLSLFPNISVFQFLQLIAILAVAQNALIASRTINA